MRINFGRRQATPAILGVVLTLLGTGCDGPQPGTVSGTVRFKGQPIAGWTVNFEMPSQGQAAITTTEADGRYSFSSPLATGEYRVFVTPPSPDPTPGAKPKLAAINPPPRAIPEEFQEEGKTRLRVEVKPGLNDLPVEIMP